jgi:hypothetical protein
MVFASTLILMSCKKKLNGLSPHLDVKRKKIVDLLNKKKKIQDIKVINTL